MILLHIRVNQRARAARRRSFPGVEALENRIALHGAAVAFHHGSAQHAAMRVAKQVTSADTQVLNTISVSIQQYSTLQVQLDALAAKIQHQSRSARQADASHAQKLANKFVKAENKRYKPIIALAPTVSGSPVTSALVQLDASIHKDLLAVKTKVIPQFRLLVGATFTSTSARSRLGASGGAVSPEQARPMNWSGARPADGVDTAEADGVVTDLIGVLDALVFPIANIALAPDTSCAFTAARSLQAYSTLLDVVDFFFEVLQPSLSPDVEGSFISFYNSLVAVYNKAVTHTNAILASNQVITH